MIKEITVQELKKMRDEKVDFLLLDVREQDEYDTCNIEGHLIPLGTLPERLNELNANQQIIIHCKSGGRSRRACEFLMAQGFTNVANLTGGISAWMAEIESQTGK